MGTIVQSPSSPERVIGAIETQLSHDTSEIRLAVAYITLGGTKILKETIERKLGEDFWNSLNKKVITCLDYAITEPKAISAWCRFANSLVLIQNASVILRPSFLPINAFHPKYYEFRSSKTAKIVMGSANLSERGLTTNHEVISVSKVISDLGELDNLWDEMKIGAIPASSTLISNYAGMRKKHAPKSILRSLPLKAPQKQPEKTLWEAISAGDCLPMGFDYLWVDTGSMTSGGSKNQLELPRGANHFFGFGFDDYEKTSVKIGDVDLQLSADHFEQRPLTWHGSNGMERINLPAVVEYSNQVILFRRLIGTFEVVPANALSDRAQGWKKASELIGHRYRVGKASNRTCGFF